MVDSIHWDHNGEILLEVHTIQNAVLIASSEGAERNMNGVIDEILSQWATVNILRYCQFIH